MRQALERLEDEFGKDFAKSVGARASTDESVASQLPGRENGPADAYRHLLWAAEMTRRFGEETARQLLEWHEDHGDAKGATADERAMDERNNEIGIAIGRQARTWEDVVSESRRAIDASAPDGSGNRIGAEYGATDGKGAQWLPPERWRKNPTDPTDDTRRMPTEETNWYTNPARKSGIDWVGGAVPVEEPLSYIPGDERFRFPQYRSEDERRAHHKAGAGHRGLSDRRLRLPGGPVVGPRSSTDDVAPLRGSLDSHPTEAAADMTAAEMRRVMKSDAYWTAGHPDHAAAQQTVKAWHDRRYGTAPAALDAAGRMLPETEPRSAAIRGALPGLFTNDDIPQKTTPAQENAQALDLLLRFARDALRSGDASGLPDAVDRGLGGLFPAIPPGRPAPWRQAVQDTINDLSRNDAAAEPLRDDGVIGPRTVASFGRTLTGAGPDRFVRRLAQNLGFA